MPLKEVLQQTIRNTNVVAGAGEVVRMKVHFYSDEIKFRV
jgi:hypothetical protein